jgi:hypothetical protein
VFCVIGAVAGSDGSSATWTLLVLAACSSAWMLMARHRDYPLTPATVRPPVDVVR